jgi:hypothetical protein
MRGDSTGDRNLCIIHITNEKSPMWAPRFQPLAFQWALAVVRRQLSYHRGRVSHWIFSPFTGKPPRMRDAPVERSDFVATAKALAHGVDAKVYFQTPHPERCKTCFYKTVCSAKHCGEVTKKEVEELRARLS